MDETLNLSGQEAVAKIRELTGKANSCLFATHLADLPLSARPMYCVKVDSDGQLWFFSNKQSELHAHIISDPRVQLFFSNSSTSEYLSIFGKATQVWDQQLLDELWTPIAKTWFKEGREDPDLSLIRVRPETGYYWDTKSNKAIQLLKIALGAVVGKPMDDGLQGRVSP